MARILGWSEPPPLPFSPTSLAGGRADSLLASAGFETWGEHHNQVSELSFALGPAGAERTWMLGLLPYMGAIAKLIELRAVGDADATLARAKAAFEVEVEAAGYVEGGEVRVPGAAYRLLSALRPG